MKQTVFILSILISGAFLGFKPATDYTTLEIGKPIPKSDVQMQDVGGKSITLSEAKGKNGLLVIFSCNTCPFVIKSEARMKEITAFASQNNLGVVVINSNEGQRDGDDSFDAMKKYKDEKQFTGFYAVDKNSTLADAFGASHTPETFLFNKTGNLVYKGGIDDNPRDPNNVSQHYLKDAIDALLKGAEIKNNSTKSLGCSIKRKGA